MNLKILNEANLNKFNILYDINFTAWTENTLCALLTEKLRAI